VITVITESTIRAGLLVGADDGGVAHATTAAWKA
jgi:hypothetical protein